MIPREILKTIRQIETRTNWLVIEPLAGRSFQPPAEVGRISFAMPDRDDDQFTVSARW